MSDLTVLIAAPHLLGGSLPPAHRVRLLIPHFEAQKVKVIILSTPHKYREERYDPFMELLIPKETIIEQTKAIQPSWTRRFGFGDLGLRLLPYWMFALPKLVRKYKVDIVMYPVPPWYILWLAPFVKLITRIPYVIDFIDPWYAAQGRKKSIKAILSNKLAQFSESFVAKHSSGIIAVSEGIVVDLKSRVKLSALLPTASIPYGVEESDFEKTRVWQKQTHKYTLIRYIGAYWKDAERPVAALFEAISLLQNHKPLKVEFVGTSYAGQGLAKKALEPLAIKTKIDSFFEEKPDRVGYEDSLSLTMEADILLLFGGMQPYYAASKLMSMLASGKKFIAFLHEDSFPAKLLKELNYPYLLCYSSVKIPENEVKNLFCLMVQLIESPDKFYVLDKNNPAYQEHSAFTMTQNFSNLLRKALFFHKNK